MSRPIDHPKKPNKHSPIPPPPPPADYFSLDWAYLADFADESPALVQCDNPDIIDTATQLIAPDYTSFWDVKGPFSDPAPGVIINGAPVLTNGDTMFDPWARHAVRFKTGEATGSNLASAIVEGQVGSGQGCFALPPDPGTTVVGQMLGAYAQEFSDLYLITVDCSGVTAEFDGSTWTVDQVNVSAAAQGMSVTAVMKRI